MDTALPTRWTRWPKSIVARALTLYALTSAFCVSSMVFGYYAIDAHSVSNPSSLFEAFATWDGRWYREIAENGYSYTPTGFSTIAMYPIYPCLASVIAAYTGLSALQSLLLLSHLSLAGTFVLLAIYVRQGGREEAEALATFSLLAFGLFPASFFCRMVYTESLFLLMVVAAMLAIQAKRHPALIGLIIGVATGIRPTGLCLGPPFLLYLYDNAPSKRAFCLDVLAFGPLACCGIGGFMLYQHCCFGDGLAFVKTVSEDDVGNPDRFLDRFVATLVLEPVWSVYDPRSPDYWRRWDIETNPLLSFRFLNPLFFLVAAFLILWGTLQGMLSRYEIVLSCGLLLLPYVTVG